MIEIRRVESAADREAFIRLPGRIMADDPHYVEPLRLEARKLLTPKGNPFLRRAEAAFFLALKDGRPAGRISAQLDRLAPLAGGRRVGYFGLPAFPDDPEIAARLFAAAEDWLRSRGAELSRGPFNLSVNQECGLLVDGFDSPPFLLMPHDPPWAAPLVEAQGYAKGRDLYVYRLPIAGPLPDRARRFAESRTEAVTLRSLDPRRYAEDIAAIAEVFNDAWSENWGFTPLSPDESQAMGEDMKPILDPGLVKIAERGGRVVGFIVMLPNVNEAIADLHGRLLPFGWAKLLWRVKANRIRSARVALMGVRKDAARTAWGKLLPFRLIYALEARYNERGFRNLEMSWLLEDNMAVRRVVESIGSEIVKTLRIYEKPL